MKHLRTGIKLAALSLSVTTLVSPVFGQESPGREGVLRFSQGFDYDLDDGLESSTGLSLDLSSTTRTQRFSFGLGTELFGDFTDGGSDDFEFRNYSANIVYSRRSARTELTFSADYTEINLDDDSFEVSPGVIIFGDGGSLTNSRVGASITTGIEAPFGLSLDASYRDSDYEGTVDPDLVDETAVSAIALATFRLSPTMTLRALAGIERIEEDDLVGTETDSSYIGIGIGAESRSGLTFSADILFDESEITTSAPSTTQTDGIGIELAATQSRPTGSVGATLSSRVDDAGRRTAVSVNRSFTLKTGSLDISLGVVDQEDVDDLQIIGDIAYSRELPRGSMSATLRRTAVTDSGDTVVGTDLSLSYSQDINAVSGWEAEVGYVASSELVADEDDDRTTATFTYRRDLTREWTMTTGVEFAREDGGSDEKSVFFNIERDITFGF